MSTVSPVTIIFESLLAINASWNAEIGHPTGAGWIHGADFGDATTGPFNDLLTRIGERANTADKLTISASFALRFGWASAMAIVPYLRFQCVPDISLDNVSFKFAPATFFERSAIHEPRGVMLAGLTGSDHSSMTTVPTMDALLLVLRDALVSQSAPIVNALYDWSGFAHRGTWGMLTSSWASQFTAFASNPHDQRSVAPQLDALFQGDDIITEMRPCMQEVAFLSEVHLYQRRASCCRYYLLDEGDLCASCPLVSGEERMRRNIEWMATQHERRLRAKGNNF
jgi:hypothetical protein